MKKILGIVALTLIMGVPAFAQNNSSVIYTLQVGGSNAGGPTVQFNTTNVHEPTDGVLDMSTTATPDVVTWSVRVTVGGEIVGSGSVGGAANLVWDLLLKGPDGQPVPGFGLSNGTTAGFFSTIMNGGAGFPIQPASFTWEYGGGPAFGRLIDAFASGGVNMAQYTFPSTLGYYLAPNASVPNTTTVGATTGTLMGMGAGYPDLDPNSGNGPERYGVGILAATDGTLNYPCFDAIGDKAPIAEGQINLAGMPGGTYTLVLTPGLGNNVITPGACDFGTTGAFATAAGSTGTGSTITFVHGGAVVQPAIITAAESWRTHGAAGSFPIPLNRAGPNATSEGRLDTRAGCNPVLVITFDKAIKDTVANPAMTVTATAVGGAAPTIGALALDGTGTKLTIPVTGSVNRTCVTYSINNVASVDGAPATTYTQKVVYVRADIDNNRNCGSSDLLGIKQKQNAFTNVNATNFWYDLDCDSKCGSSDLLLCKQLQNAFVTTACAIP